MNKPFTFVVVLMSGTPQNEGAIITKHAPFEVKISVDHAEVRGAELSSWIVFDIKMGGTKTVMLEYGAAAFKDITLNIGFTYVWLKVEVVNPPDSIYAALLSTVSPQILEVVMLAAQVPVEEPEYKYIDESTSTFVTSTLDQDLNQYSVDSHVLQEMRARNSEKAGNFGRPMLTVDHYDRADCDFGLTPALTNSQESQTSRLNTAHYALGECYASGDLVSSSKIISADSLRIVTHFFPQSASCQPPSAPTLGRSADPGAAVVVTDLFANVCVPSQGQGNGRSRFFRAVLPPGACTSSFAQIAQVVPGGEKRDARNPVVRIREWAGSYKTRDTVNAFLMQECSERDEQPKISTYAMNVCYKDQQSRGGAGTFKFVGCVGRAALVNQYGQDDCSGTTTQKKWGETCFVGQQGGWYIGAGAGNDFAVECGVVCAAGA